MTDKISENTNPHVAISMVVPRYFSNIGSSSNM
jgi:hypothetical protein